jgi:DNA-binding transcriptional LysR family regulator
MCYSSEIPIDISLRHLRAFVAIATHLSFTRAAHALGRTQPTVTETLRELEQMLGVTLISRTTRSVELTIDGNAFAELALRMVRDFDGLVADMRSLGNLERGRVRVVAAPSVAMLLLPVPLSIFTRNHPGVRISLADVTSLEAERQVLDGQADIAITSLWSRNPRLAFAPLLEDRFGAVFHAGHSLAQTADALPWDALTNERCIGLANATGIRTILRAEAGLPEAVTNPFYEAATTTSLEMMVQQGLGVAVLPALAAARAPLSSLPFRPLVGPSASRVVGVISIAGAKPSRAAQHLLTEITAHIRTITLPAHVALVG